ncbi:MULTISPECIES: NUDIX hydrolase [Caballeronia]|uniref:ADP-ribose pyrophosphatase n=1 Tax=Caballeronia zhejiangensis TaxID=871203 RepID=A0A656QVU7_9BURK|nr:MULTISPECIES: NUDIX hydrolase [Caballeronia]KDR33878.1 ADP-ribose pyrophosphatase [Caballeronia zhejiangensis]MDR5788750.1 NUDIX hydrolase [Caballeronia sp. LP003]
MSSNRRLEQARRLLALAQTGLHYTNGAFDKERYEEIATIAHEQLAEIASMKAGEVAELFAFESGYANPKLDVRCAVFNESGYILLVREAADGLWSLPGGWADVGLSPAENAAKEVREESGYTVDIVRLLAAWDTAKHPHPPSVFHIWKLVFLGEIVGTGNVIGVETDAVEFFSLDDLPPLSLGRIMPAQIRRLDALRRGGEVDFD